MKPRPIALPLFLQALGLVIATLIAALTAILVVVLSLPPPPAEVYTVSDVAQIIRSPSEPPVVGSADAALAWHMAQRPPLPGDRLGLRRRFFLESLAREIGVPPEHIVLSQHGPRVVAFGGRRSRPRPALSNGAPPPLEPLLFGHFQIGVLQPDGRWMIIEPRKPFGLDPWQERLLLVTVLAAAAVAPLAWAFSRRLAAPISALAAGADRLGRDPNAPPLDVSGSAEVSQAVAAFNQMQERLRKYVEDRTTMVGAIAHDLRTPLTRMRFRVEDAPEPLRTKLQADIDQMEALISATMSFVRGAARPQTHSKLEISSLVETVVDDLAMTGADAAVEQADRVVIDGDAIGLKRLFSNLIDNAVKYGGQARARVYADGAFAVVEIDDRGPGVPPPELERVFEPFHRVEGSRSRETGGIGLGLAVVRAVARGHGGDVCLINLTGGGLRARVTLPLSADLAAGARRSTKSNPSV